MKCQKCGREMSGEYDVCRACGTPVTQRRHAKAAGLLTVLTSDAKMGARTVRVWVMCLVLVGVVGALAGLSVAMPYIIDAITTTADELIPEQIVVPDTKTEIDKVSGNIIIPTADFDQCTVTSETAWSDGSWQRVLSIDGVIEMSLYRFKTAGDSWVNTHVFALYPDIAEAENFPNSVPVSGYSSQRIQISGSESAVGCVVEVVRITDGVYDYLCISEIPTDRFSDYEDATDRWAQSLILADADTLVEQPKPASDSIVSPGDGDAASSADVQ